MRCLAVRIALPAGLWAASAWIGIGNLVPPPVVKPVLPETPSYQLGKAAWYGSEFDGRETASGETFDMNAFTAAHRELPLGALVLVTNLGNGKSVVVRVNDRGPWGDPERVIDLSYAASRELDMLY